MLKRRLLAGFGLLAAACAPATPTTSPAEPAARAPMESIPANAVAQPPHPAGTPGLLELERARTALREGRIDDAIVSLRLASSSLPAVERVLCQETGLLLGAALQATGEQEQAESHLLGVEPCLARQLLLAATLAFREGGALRGPLLARFTPADVRPDDRSLQLLRSEWPAALPSIAAATLACGLADAKAEPLDAGPSRQAEAAVSALEWQALEVRLAVDGLRDAPGEVAARHARAQAWVRGELAPDEAVVDVFADDTGALLLLCTPGREAQVLLLPPSSVLLHRAKDAVEALRSAALPRLVEAAVELAQVLLPAEAREPLAPLPRWTLILPDPFLGLPPTAWVLTAPATDEPARFLVEDHVLRLLPHVPGTPVAAAPAGARWLDVSAPAVALDSLPALRDDWTQRYTASALQAPMLPPLPGATALTGAQATVPALLAALPGCAGLRISAPGAGAGALGGLLLAPVAEASAGTSGAGTGDEALGLLTWPRLAQFPLPPVVLCDGTRFDPADVASGARLPATALLAHASSVLLARWPEAPSVRQPTLRHVSERLAAGEPLDLALTTVLREWLSKARPSGAEPPLHPRTWAAFLPFVRD